jgi:hypothetical protein
MIIIIIMPAKRKYRPVMCPYCHQYFGATYIYTHKRMCAGEVRKDDS